MSQTSRSRGLEWPVGIALMLLTVVLVNMAFIWIATSEPPEITPSYEIGPR